MKEWENTKLQILEYMYNQENRLENDLVDIYNRMRCRSMDNIDCIELMEANVRLQTAREVYEDIRRIVRRWK